MLTEYLLTSILEAVNMPAEITAGILALYKYGLLQSFISLLTVCLGLLCISVKKSFIEQSSRTPLREPFAVLAGGVVAYGLAIALMAVFVLSVAGFPVAVLVFLVTVFFIVVGQASLSVMAGDIFFNTFGIFQSALIGAIIIEGLKYLPYIGWLLRYLVFPVAALGAVTAGVSNGYIKKKFYPDRDGGGAAAAPPEGAGRADSAARERIRGLVLGCKAGGE